MVNRKEIELERFISEIDHIWKLSVTETELLEGVLNIIKIGEDITDLAEFIDYFVEKDYSEILDFVPSSYKEDWAEWNGYTDEDDCKEKTLEDFEDDEIEQEYFDRFDKTNYRRDIVTDIQYNEMSDLFLSLSFTEREKILKQIRK